MRLSVSMGSPFPAGRKGMAILFTLAILAASGLSPAYAAPGTPTGQAYGAGGYGQVGTGYDAKWIDVDLSSQSLVAYQGNQPVLRSLISSGIPRHPTLLGTFYIYVKLFSTRMTGGVGREHYDLPNVPYTMYFYAGYGLHGTYWHHNFGYPMSHGCVNLPTPIAQWLFYWAPVGTKVVIHV